MAKAESTEIVDTTTTTENTEDDVYKSLEAKVNNLTDSVTTLAQLVSDFVTKSKTEEVIEEAEAELQKAEAVAEEAEEVIERHKIKQRNKLRRPKLKNPIF